MQPPKQGLPGGFLIPLSLGQRAGLGAAAFVPLSLGQRAPTLGCFWLQWHELKRATTF